MRESNPHTKNQKSNIRCLEVLIPKSFIAGSGHNLHWTLSVYSLENQPVKKNRAIHNSEIFHFMVYDWKRTIKQLLEDQKIPYSIIQYFSPETIYHDATHGNSSELMSLLQSVPDTRDEVHKKVREILSGNPGENAELTLEEESH